MKSILCLLGLHDWRRRGGVYVPGPKKSDNPEKPPPTGYVTECFEQCRRCDATRWGWRVQTKFPDPKPQPWE